MTDEEDEKIPWFQFRMPEVDPIPSFFQKDRHEAEYLAQQRGKEILDERTADDVALGLERNRMAIANWVAVLAGIFITLGGPVLLVQIKQNPATRGTWLFPLGIAGLIIAGVSVALGVAAYLMYMRALRLNPHHYFLLDKGDSELAEVYTELWPAPIKKWQKIGVNKKRYEVVKESHLFWDKWSKRLPWLQVLTFAVALLLVLVDVVAFAVMFKP